MSYRWCLSAFLLSLVQTTAICVSTILANDPQAAPQEGVPCATPNPPRHTFHVDPVQGTSAGDGSSEKPWRTLQEVIEAKRINGEDDSQGDVHAGDLVYLRSGNHGTIQLSPQTGRFNNTDFITIQAAPGQTPVLNGLMLKGASKWVFRGLTFQPPEKIPEHYVLVRTMATPNSRVHDIVFSENMLYSQPDVSTWTPEDWGKLAVRYALMFDGDCAVITNNHIKNVRFGISVCGDNITVSRNELDFIADDFIEVTSSNTVISHNRMTNHYGQMNDSNHNDFIQGWVPKGVDSLRNLVIEGNVAIASTGTYAAIPPIPTGTGQDYVQGMSIFDGKWTNVKIVNNLVVTKAYWGIGFAAEISDSLIANNTVISLPDPKITAWIGVQPSKTKQAPQNIVVRNNIAHTYLLHTEGVQQDHNLSFTQKTLWNWKGRSGGTLTKMDPAKLFLKWDLEHADFDFRLRPGSPAIQAGNPLDAPPTDLLGNPRDPASVDLGAYVFSQ